MVFSTSVTSSPNGSFEAAGGGTGGSGACIDASERTATLTAAAAAAGRERSCRREPTCCRCSALGRHAVAGDAQAKYRRVCQQAKIGGQPLAVRTIGLL